MTASLLSGKPLAKLIQQQAQTEAKTLAEEGTCPTLAVVVATEDSSTHWYVRSIERAAEAAGINCRIIDVGHDATEQVLITVLKDLSAEPSVNGIILQTPLPPGVRTQELVKYISPEKDIDGANPQSLGLLAVGERAFAPAPALSCSRVKYHVSSFEIHVLAIGVPIRWHHYRGRSSARVVFVFIAFEGCNDISAVIVKTDIFSKKAIVIAESIWKA